MTRIGFGQDELGPYAQPIAIDQDPLGRQGRRARKDGDVEVRTKPLNRSGR